MEDIFDSDLNAEEKAKIIKQCDEYLAAIDRIHEESVEEQKKIDKITAETWAILRQLRKAA